MSRDDCDDCDDDDDKFNCYRLSKSIAKHATGCTRICAGKCIKYSRLHVLTFHSRPDRALLKGVIKEQLKTFNPLAEVQSQLNELNAHDLPLILSESDVAYLKQKVESVNRSDVMKQKSGVPLTLDDVVRLAVQAHLRCSVSGVRGVLQPGALLQLSIDAVDSTKSHSRDNVQLTLLYINLAKNVTPDAEFRSWAASAFKN